MRATPGRGTLSLAYHLTGDTAKAIETQNKAIALLPEGESDLRTTLEASLAGSDDRVTGDCGGTLIQSEHVIPSTEGLPHMVQELVAGPTEPGTSLHPTSYRSFSEGMFDRQQGLEWALPTDWFGNIWCW